MIDLFKFLSETSNFLWNYIILILLIIISLFFTLKTNFMQFLVFKRIKTLIKTSNINPSTKHLSSMQALLSSLGGAVGVGSIAGMAIAINNGGLGAIFWLWIVAFLGMSLSMVENTLGQVFKRKNADKSFYVGGPSFYIKHGLKNQTLAKILSVLFSIFLIFGYGITFNAIQSNTIVESLHNAFNFNKEIVVICVMLLTAVIIFGGIKRVAKVSFYIVPFMGIVYIFLTLCVIILNITQVPNIFYLIISNAFNFKQAVAGSLGGVITTAMVIGAKRALFASEAGVGSSPNLTASAHVKHPINQGIFGAFAIFIITFIICTSSAFIVALGNQYGGSVSGIALVQNSLISLLGNWSIYFLFIAVFIFAFTSIIGNYSFSQVNVEFLTSKKIYVFILKIVIILSVYLGGTLNLSQVWDLGDLSVALMILINITVLFILRNVFFAVLKDYKTQLKNNKEPEFNATNIKELTSDSKNIWK